MVRPNVRSPDWPVDPGTAVTIKVAADGRILVPSHLRRAAGIERGKSVTVKFEDGRLVIEDSMASLKRLQDLLAPLWIPGESVVDDLIADRRAEAARE